MSGFLKKLLLLVLIVLVVLQLLPVERTNPETKMGEDFLEMTHASKEVSTLIKGACYDCHSHNTIWPWYSYVAPASWVIADHVRHGRGELNFSTWAQYDTDRKEHKLEECMEALVEGWMPEEGYVSMHDEAKLSDKQRAILVNFFKEQKENLK